MKTRKPTLNDNIRMLKNEIERRKFFLSTCNDSERKEDEKWIANAEKTVRSFYAPSYLS